MTTSIWIKPSGVEVNVDSASYESAESFGWKPKDQEPAVEEKKRGRPAKSKEA